MKINEIKKEIDEMVNDAFDDIFNNVSIDSDDLEINCKISNKNEFVYIIEFDDEYESSGYHRRTADDLEYNIKNDIKDIKSTFEYEIKHHKILKDVIAKVETKNPRCFVDTVDVDEDEDYSLYDISLLVSITFKLKQGVVDSISVHHVDSNHILDLIHQQKKINDIEFKYMSPEGQELKKELGLLKTVAGSHKSRGIKEYKTRNRYSQYAELNECINEGLENLAKGEMSEKAWSRLSLKLKAWEQDPEYKEYVYKARAAIKKFERYLEIHKNAK